MRDRMSDALRYWEPRRVVYNLFLALIVVIYFAKSTQLRNLNFR